MKSDLIFSHMQRIWFFNTNKTPIVCVKKTISFYTFPLTIVCKLEFHKIKFGVSSKCKTVKLY